VRFRSSRTQALVTGTMRLGEADRIVHLYTRDRGLVSAVAKGVRKTLSRTGGRLEPFSLVDVVLYQGRSLPTVTGVDTVRAFAGIRESLFRIEEGGELLTTVRRLLPEEEGNTAAFNLLVRGVAALCVSPDRDSAAKVVLSTRLKLLVSLGYMPRFDSCSRCGGTNTPCGIDTGSGEFLCAGCMSAAPALQIGVETVDLLEHLLERPLAEVDLAASTPPTLAEAKRITHILLESHSPG